MLLGFIIAIHLCRGVKPYLMRGQWQYFPASHEPGCQRRLSKTVLRSGRWLI